MMAEYGLKEELFWLCFSVLLCVVVGNSYRNDVHALHNDERMTHHGSLPTINVHLIPHSHQDCGWLKTVDQYFYGLNSSIYNVGVQNIYDSVVTSLLDNANRRFVAIEMAFFSRWYYLQPLFIRNQVKLLVQQGRLSFANGGWCMHDEAASHWMSQIEHTTLGHRFLKSEFNFEPSVGWQIDPFGHSATQASLLSAEIGFDALFFGRIDYQEHNQRASKQELEFIWRGSKSLPHLGSLLF